MSEEILELYRDVLAHYRASIEFDRQMDKLNEMIRSDEESIDDGSFNEWL